MGKLITVSYRYHPDDEPYPMRRMGCTHDPGPLPFVTIRRHDWANRLTIGELIEIHGEHGCPMAPTAARVVAIEAHPHPPPPALASVYAGQKLVAVSLDPAPGWKKVGEDWVRV